MGLASLSVKLKKEIIEGRNGAVFFMFLSYLIPIRQCDRNSPFLNLNQLVFAGIEKGTYRTQDIRNGAKIRKLLSVGALRSPGLGISLWRIFGKGRR